MTFPSLVPLPAAGPLAVAGPLLPALAPLAAPALPALPPMPVMLPPAPAQVDFEVEAIISHRDFPNGSMLITVRWVGYDASSDSEVPDHELMHSASTLYADYMRSLPQASRYVTIQPATSVASACPASHPQVGARLDQTTRSTPLVVFLTHLLHLLSRSLSGSGVCHIFWPPLPLGPALKIQ
jgi:hypothetical protein